MMCQHQERYLYIIITLLSAIKSAGNENVTKKVRERNTQDRGPSTGCPFSSRAHTHLSAMIVTSVAVRQEDRLLGDSDWIIKADPRGALSGSLCSVTKRSVLVFLCGGLLCSWLAGKLALDTTKTPWLLSFLLGMRFCRLLN